MGNNTSTSTPPPLVSTPQVLQPPPVPPPPTPVAPNMSQSGENKVDAKPVPSTNPGTYEELHKKCKDLFPQVFDGAKVVISKGLSSHFQISHTVTLASPTSSGYRFGATYVGTKQFGPQEMYPIMLGDIDVDGNLNANIIHAFSKNIITRFVAQYQGEKANTQIVTDYKANSYTASLTVANPDLLNGSGLLVSQYLQRITPSLDLGAECMYTRGGHIPGDQIAVMSLAARIIGNKWQLASSFCPFGPNGGAVHASYYHKISDTLQVGTEFETNTGVGESTGSVGYQLEIPSAGVTFRGEFNTSWYIQATMEKKLMETQLPFTFILSALGNVAKSDFKFGIGMILG